MSETLAKIEETKEVERNKGEETKAAFVLDKGMEQFSRMPSQPEVVEPDSNGRRVVQPTSSFQGPSKFPLYSDAQKFVLFNLTNRKQLPRHSEPGYRILGYFPSKEEAIKHVEKYFQNPEVHVYVGQTHTLDTICESVERQHNVEYRQKNIEAITQNYTNKLEANRREFEKNLANRTTGKVSEMPPDEEEGDTEEAAGNPTQKAAQRNDTAEDDGLPSTSAPISAQCQLIRQNYSVVIHIKDERKERGEVPEPLFAALGAFSTVEDATDYAKNTASKQYPDCRLDIVDNYEWLFPMSVNPDEIEEAYGCEQLHDIMAGRKKNIESCKAYQKFREENPSEDKKEVNEEEGTEGGVEKRMHRRRRRGN